MTQSSINTQNRSKNYAWTWHTLNSVLQVKTFYHIEKQGLGYLWLSNKKIQTPKPAEAKLAQFQKGQPTPCKTMYVFSRSLLG